MKGLQLTFLGTITSVDKFVLFKKSVVGFLSWDNEKFIDPSWQETI